MKRQPIDPVAARAQFGRDMAAMNGGVKREAGAPVKNRMLNKNFKLAEFAFRRWSATLDETQTLEDALDPTFWSELSATITGQDKASPKGRGDIIEVRKLDTGLYAELHVTEVGVGYIRVDLVRASEPKSVEIATDSKLTTKWNVGSKTHDVIRKADSQVMQSGFQTKATAAAWIEKHTQAMAA